MYDDKRKGKFKPDIENSKRSGSPYLIASSIIAILISEFLIMVFLPRVTSLSHLAISFIDAAVLSLLAFPFLNFLTFKPLIKNRDNTEKALLEANQTSQSILKTAANLIMLIDENGVIRDCNNRSATFLGHSPGKMIGQPIFSIIVPEYYARARKSLRAVVTNDVLLNEEMAMLKSDGMVIDVSINSSSLREKRGGFISAVWIIDDITARKRTEEALQLTQFSIDKSADAIYWMDQEARIVNVNNAACKALGYSREELLSLTIYDIDPDFHHHIWGPYWVDLKLRGSCIIAARHKTKNGMVFPVEIAANFIEYGGKEYSCAFARDITDRKQVEMELKTLNEQLKMSIENMPLAYVLWDTEFKVKEWNRAAERIFGYARDEVLSKTLTDLIIPWNSRQFAERVYRKLADGFSTGFSQKDNNIRKDGTLISCRWYNTPLKNKDGSIFAVLSMAEDLTDQLRIREELKNVNERFREFTELLPQTVFELDREGNILYNNKHGLSFTGYTQKDIEDGMNASSLFGSNELSKLRKALIKILKGGKVDGIELVMTKSNGSMVNIVVFANPVYEAEVVTGIRGIMVDITETKKLQEFASRAQRLEIAGRIAGQVAHDFNNLLGPLFAFPDFIKEKLPEGSEAIYYLDHIQKAAEQMAEINQQLLTLGRRGHYNQIPLNLNDIISRTIEGMGSIPDSLIIETDLAENLGAINGGSSQISRMLTNLINNACESMNNSGRLYIKTENLHVDKIWIKYGRVPEGDYVKITFIDTGRGIPVEALPHIFDPFYTTKESDSKRGSGLGLSIAHSVMEDHNGYIDVKSEEGQGASFYIYFPLAYNITEFEIDNQAVGGNESILVVDDEELQRNVTCKLLVKLGYDATAVESGEKAVEFLRNNPRDLILLDMVMAPGIDGLETFKRITRICPDQKVLIVSGYADTDKIEAAAELGVLGFVGKPLSLKSIDKAIRTALKGELVNI